MSNARAATFPAALTAVALLSPQEGCPLSVAALRSWDGRDVSVSPVRDAKRLRKEDAPPPPSPAEFRRWGIGGAVGRCGKK